MHPISAELNTQLTEVFNEVDELKQTNTHKDEEIDLLKKAMMDKDEEASKRQSMLEEKLNQLERMKTQQCNYLWAFLKANI